jgi:hypothetical protein
MKIFCKLGFHLWKTTKEKHSVINHPHNREFIRIIVRECQFCGERQRWIVSDDSHTESRWEPFPFQIGDLINYENITIDANTTIQHKNKTRDLIPRNTGVENATYVS